MLIAKGQVPRDEACRSLRKSTVFGRLPTAVTTSQRDSCRSLSPELEAKAVSKFSESGREECSSGRNDAPGLRVLGAKLRLHQVFCMLVAKPRVPVAKCDYAPGFFEP